MSVDLTKKPVAAIAPFGLRLQPDLKSRIEAAARVNNRSLNAEIVARLEASEAAEDAIRRERTLAADIDAIREEAKERETSLRESEERLHRTVDDLRESRIVMQKQTATLADIAEKLIEERNELRKLVADKPKGE